jgi:hypothetical protein
MKKKRKKEKGKKYCRKESRKKLVRSTEPEFLNFLGAQESIPRNRFQG